jgi:hypothetical protein
MTQGMPNNLGKKGPINALCCLKDFKRLNQRMTLPDPLTQRVIHSLCGWGRGKNSTKSEMTTFWPNQQLD